MTDVQHRLTSPPRRRFLSLAGFAGLLGVGGLGRGAEADQPRARPTAQPIVQPSIPSEQTYIDRAFEMRQLAIEHGDQPFGAIVVRDGRIMGQSWSRVVLDSDPTGHAEMSALRDAARRADGASLSGAMLYSSSHPCAMCEAAAAWVGIAVMVHGRSIVNAGAPRSCR